MSGRMLTVEQVMPVMGDFVPSVRGYMSCTPAGAHGYGVLTICASSVRTCCVCCAGVCVCVCACVRE